MVLALVLGLGLISMRKAHLVAVVNGFGLVQGVENNSRGPFLHVMTKTIFLGLPFTVITYLDFFLTRDFTRPFYFTSNF